MKRLITVAVLITGLLTSMRAQEKFIDHLSIGIDYGTVSVRAKNHFGYIPHVRPTDGLGVSIAAQITDWLEVRAGLSATHYTYDSYGFSVEGVPDGQYVTKEIGVKLRSGAFAANLFLDFYPFKKVPVHFTAGTYAGTSTILHVYNIDVVPYSLGSYNTGVLEMQGMAIPTDRDGKIDARLKLPPVRPYLGVGIATGRMFERKGVNVDFNFGVMYKGNNGMTITGPGGRDVEIDYYPSSEKPARLIEWSKRFPVSPVISVRVFCRIF